MSRGADVKYVLVTHEAELDSATAAAVGVGSVPAAQQDRRTDSTDSTDSTPMSDSVLQSLLHEYRDRFPDKQPDGLRPEKNVAHAIPTEPGSSPADRHMYSMSPRTAEKVEMERQITEGLRMGIIEPSTSPYGAPLLFVTKQDGGLHICVDNRALCVDNRAQDDCQE